MRYLKIYGISLLFFASGLLTSIEAQAVNNMASYVSTPVFMSSAIPPNVLIIFDNSGSMNMMAYWEEAEEHLEGTPWWQEDIVPTTPYDPTRNYYGYFVSGTPSSRVMYSYSSGKFRRDAAGQWEGNFLNWLCMRRADVSRKVLVGGRASVRDGSGTTTLTGEDPVQSGRSYKCILDALTMFAYTPFDDFANRYVGVKDGRLYVSKDLDSNPFEYYDYDYNIAVERDSSYADEASDFVDGNIAGVMQKVGDKAYWGLEFFRTGTGGNDNGGYIKNRVGHPTVTNLYANIESEPMRTWTPLAESYYVAMQYVKQQSLDASLASSYSPNYQINSTWDPYNQDGNSASCAKSFVLIFTDGASTKDGYIPDAYKQYDGDSHDPNTQTPGYSSDGTDYLDDIALYGRVNDLRPDLDDEQNLELFVVYAFGDEPEARRLLKDAAKNGGFIDKNDNNLPDPATGDLASGTQVVQPVDYSTPPTDESWSEWWADGRTDIHGDAMPDSYFEAQDGWLLEQQLINAITEILERGGSGTAVSVLATSGEGEGALYQAYFKPKFSTATEEVHWAGYLQSLWVDALGNLREDWTSAADQSPNGILDLGIDPIVSFFHDNTTGQTKFERRSVSSSDPYGVLSTPTVRSLDDLGPLWEAGDVLANRIASDRSIYTFVDLDGDGKVDGNRLEDKDEFISFDTNTVAPDDNLGKLTAYLDLADDIATGGEDYTYLGDIESYRVRNLIRYIRGNDSGFDGSTDLRNRTADSKVWKLGDVIHSTPTPVGRPVDNYDVIYSDSTYADFYKQHKNRETVVYVGANDGMLHAFLAGVFNPGEPSTGDGAYFSRDPVTVPDKYDSSLGSNWQGAEIWAYIPQSLLPHLKWLPDPDYANINHVYYVDQKPRVFDAQIYEGADTGGHPLNGVWTAMSAAQKADRPHGWCTMLVGGLRFGGGSIDVEGDFDNDGTDDALRTFASSYFAIDVTDPLNPILLWETNDTDYPGLGFTTSFPAILKVDKKEIDVSTDPDTINVLEKHWYLLFGSGPTSYDGTSAQSSSVFLVDLATGRTDPVDNPGRIFTKLTNSDGTDSATSLPANGFMGSPVSVDLTIDYSVNVSYMGETHESGSTYDGGLYRLQVPVSVDTANGQPVLIYDVEPSHWTLSQMFDADFGITAAPSVAVGTVDSNYSLWVYAGTGRYLSNSDKADSTPQYLYGIKDPYYNFKLDDTQRNTLLGLEPSSVSSLFNATDVKVYTDGSTSLPSNFSELKAQQGYGQSLGSGWYRSLDLSGERIINKPSVLGGILLAPSFVPTGDICGFGGDSYLYALYYETGTAYFKSVVGVNPDDSIKDKIDLGAGLSSSLGIHIGREHGARGFVQQSTGTVNQVDLQPAFNVKSGFVNWREVR